MMKFLKRCGVNKWSASALLIAFVTVPLPGLKGSPTGVILAHDHASRYVRKNSIDLSNHKIANYNSSQAIRNENDMARVIQNKRTQLMLLQFRFESISNDKTISSGEKRDKLGPVERRIERLFDGLDKDGIREQDLRSKTTELMVADLTM